MCERSSRVSGSMMANSSSMPRVNVCFFALMAETKCLLKPKPCHPECWRGRPWRQWEANHFPYRFAVACRSYASLPKQRFVIVANVPGANF